MNALVLSLLLAWPAHMEVAAGGMSIESDKVTNQCWYDPKSGYYACKNWECDGAIRGILITKERKRVSGAGFGEIVMKNGQAVLEEVSTGAIAQHSIWLSTKGGIKIGAPRKDILDRLGKPATIKKIGHKVALTYQARQSNRYGEKVDLWNCYTFQGDKLVEIEISYTTVENDSEDGG